MPTQRNLYIEEDSEVKKITANNQQKLKMQKLAATDNDGIDYAAAGVKDLNNFKGYHNNNEAKQDAIN